MIFVDIEKIIFMHFYHTPLHAINTFRTFNIFNYMYSTFHLQRRIQQIREIEERLNTVFLDLESNLPSTTSTSTTSTTFHAIFSFFHGERTGSETNGDG